MLQRAAVREAGFLRALRLEKPPFEALCCAFCGLVASPSAAAKLWQRLRQLRRRLWRWQLLVAEEDDDVPSVLPTCRSDSKSLSSQVAPVEAKQPRTSYGSYGNGGAIA